MDYVYIIRKQHFLFSFLARCVLWGVLCQFFHDGQFTDAVVHFI